MISPSRYYEDKLYPLQDGVLEVLSRSGTDFFLTGGTALSRAYYNHRYSEDLDFFVNESGTFDEQLDAVLSMLRGSGYNWDQDVGYIRSEYFATIGICKTPEVILKLDFVNDMTPRFGEVIKTDLFLRTDCVRNILSNKLSAIYRYAAKDVADIREIALREDINWSLIIQETRKKEACVDLVHISEILCGIPQYEFDSIQWVAKPDWDCFREDIRKIAYDMLNG